MKKLSMVMTSRQRKVDLERYVKSLNNQSRNILQRLQLIFVDQGDNVSVFEALDKNVEFVYQNHEPCSLSKARNIGLEYADGEYICFPDDDCWYDDNTLEKVYSYLNNSPNDDGLVIMAKDDNDVKISDFPDKERWLTYTNHCCALSISIFIKNDRGIRFDENIGVGSKYNLSSGEETDYILTYMERHPNFRIKYKPDIVIRHPNAKHEGFDSAVSKVYGYARGNGYIIRKHNFSLLYKSMCLIKPVLWIFIRCFCNRQRLKSTIAYTKGRYEGFFFKIKDLKNDNTK